MSNPGQTALDQVNLDAHWGNILRSFRDIKGRRFNIGALLRGCHPIIDTDQESSLMFVFTHRNLGLRALEELRDNGPVKEKIKAALMVATGEHYEHLMIDYPMERTPVAKEDLPW